jgi:hypothetical protein
LCQSEVFQCQRNRSHRCRNITEKEIESFRQQSEENPSAITKIVSSIAKWPVCPDVRTTDQGRGNYLKDRPGFLFPLSGFPGHASLPHPDVRIEAMKGGRRMPERSAVIEFWRANSNGPHADSAEDGQLLHNFNAGKPGKLARQEGEAGSRTDWFCREVRRQRALGTALAQERKANSRVIKTSRI